MIRHALTLITLLLWLGSGGCNGGSHAGPGATGQQMFTPVQMKVHPVFTKVDDWSGDTSPDGVEALVELQDSFGDTTKCAGTFVFELYAFQPNSLDPRGGRVASWQGPIDTPELQRQRWSRTSRCYAFRLTAPDLKYRGNYVLAATFTPTGGERLFDQIVLGPAPQ